MDKVSSGESAMGWEAVGFSVERPVHILYDKAYRLN